MFEQEIRYFFSLPLARSLFVPVRKPHIVGVHDIGTYCDIRYNETRPPVIVTKNFSLSLTRRRRPKHYSLRRRRVSDHNNNKKTRTMPPPLSSELSTKRAFTKRVSEMKGKKKSGRERKVVKMEEEKRKGDRSLLQPAEIGELDPVLFFLLLSLLLRSRIEREGRRRPPTDRPSNINLPPPSLSLLFPSFSPLLSHCYFQEKAATREIGGRPREIKTRGREAPQKTVTVPPPPPRRDIPYVLHHSPEGQTHSDGREMRNALPPPSPLLRICFSIAAR